MKSETPHICALILAGGLSSRMGYQDKGLLQLNGLCFVEHIAQQLEKQVSQIIVSSNNNQQAYQDLGFDCINDKPFPSEGPLCAIAAGLEKIECDYLLVVPCDSPYLSATLVKQFFLKLQKNNVNIACLKRNDKIEPLFCLIHSSLSESLKENIKSGLRKTQDWILSESHILVEDFSVKKHFNINTPTEFKELKTNVSRTTTN